MGAYSIENDIWFPKYLQWEVIWPKSNKKVELILSSAYIRLNRLEDLIMTALFSRNSQPLAEKLYQLSLLHEGNDGEEIRDLYSKKVSYQINTFDGSLLITNDEED